MADNAESNEKDEEEEAKGDEEKEDNEEEVGESAGEQDEEIGCEKKSEKRKPKVYFDEIYGEEFGGEGFYPPPSDLNILLRSTEDLKQAVFETETFPEKKQESFEDVYESSEMEVTSELSVHEKEEEEEEEKEEHEEKPEEPRKLSIASMSSYEYETSLKEYFIKVMEKTSSEIQFESEYREIIEEKMKKIIRMQEMVEEKEKKKDERPPIEKKKILISQIDVSRLYPPPKVVESEKSFAFDEDEEAEKGQRGIQAETDVIQFIMDILRDSLRHDTESIFAKNMKEAIQNVKSVVEEIVSIKKKGKPVDIEKTVNENLSSYKFNLKNILIIRLKEKLEAAVTTIGQEEEEESKPAEDEKEKIKRVKRKAKTKAIKKVESAESVEKPHVSVEIEPTKAPPTEKPVTVIAKLVEEETKIEGETEEKEEEIPYEKIDWQQYLTESERQLAIDPALKSEMDKFLEQRKKELEAEQKILSEKMARKHRYDKVKDPLEKLKNLNLNITMKFTLNTGDTYTCAYRYLMPFKEIKEDLSAMFKVPASVLMIYRDEVEIKDEQTAFDLKPEVEPFESVTFRLATSDDRWKLKSEHLDLPVPDIITCTVETGKDYRGVAEYKDVVVEIENRKIAKPFVGGYRDCKTGTEYHHAFSQSGPPPPKLPWDRRVTRDTQTVSVKKKLVDTVCDKSTQMARRDYYVSTEYDKIITAKPYVDYDTWYKGKGIEDKVRTIQRYLKAMILRRFLKEKSEEYRKRKCWEIEQEEKRMLERENRIKTDIINMTYPKTKADFDMLYALVEKWRKAQIERVSKLKTEAPKKAELCSILEKEIKLLEAIEVHRIAIKKEQRRIKSVNFMEKVAKPITWTGYRGMTIKMDTLKTQRARELKEMYQSLSRHDLGYEDRIELLISLKYSLRDHGTRLTEELTSLINQECEMLIRGVKAKNLEYLRQRIEHLFAEYFKDPSYNPEAAKHDPMLNKEPLRNNIVFCKLCHQMKPLKEFYGTARNKYINICSACQWLYNIAIPRIDLNPYRYILKTVRRDEQKRNCYSSCAFILQDEDMRFLVQNIWHDRSAVSENDNLIDLRMPRWNKDKDWTPWNCILLTELEAKAHLKTKPEDNYEPQLIGEIVTKHEMAKKRFEQLFSKATRLRDSGKWANTVDVKDYAAPPITADIWNPTADECERFKHNRPLYAVHETKRKEFGYVQYI